MAFAAGAGSGEQRLTRARLNSRSLECTGLSVCIPGTEQRQKGNRSPYTVYLVQCASGLSRWEVPRRYKEFYQLHTGLTRELPGTTLPRFPGKKYLGSSMDAGFIEERRARLEAYLAQLVRLPQVWVFQEVVQFLDSPETHSLTLLWNFERMSKMQRVLGQMQWETAEQTTNLEAKHSTLQEDLRASQEEVAELRARMQRMEEVLAQQLGGPGPGTEAAAAATPGASTERDVVELSQSAMGVLERMHRSRSADDASRSRLRLSLTLAGLAPEQQAPVAVAVARMPPVAEEVEPPPSPALMPQPWHTTWPPRALTVGGGGSSSSGSTTSGVSTATVTAAAIAAASARHGSLDSTSSACSSQSQETDNISDLALDDGCSDGGVGPERVPETLLVLLQTGAGDAATQLAFRRVDELLRRLQPTPASQMARQAVYGFVRDLAQRCIGAQVLPTGSFALRTYLPDGDVDVVVFLAATQEQSWFFRLNEAMCQAAAEGSGSDPFVVRNVTFVNAAVKLVKCQINNTLVDVSANQLGALAAVQLLDRADRLIGKDHLLKRTLLLLKAWCKHDSRHLGSSDKPILGSGEGALSTYGLNLLVLALFNAYSVGREVEHPLQAVAAFFDVYASFDWTSHAVTLDGPVRTVTLQPVSVPGLAAEGLLGAVAPLDAEGAAAAAAEAEFPHRYCNIVDPLRPCNNVGKSVTAQSLQLFRQRLVAGRQRLAAVLCDLPSGDVELDEADGGGEDELLMHPVDVFFAASWELYEEGRREDLLAHPRAVWRADMAGPPAAPGDDLLACDPTELARWMDCARAVLTDDITDTALIALVHDALRGRALPVGEVGKLLQEATNNPALSATLKEKYGGLKKFLEAHPEDVVVLDDHPFNPNVHAVGFTGTVPSSGRRADALPPAPAPAPAPAPGPAAASSSGRSRRSRRRGGGGSGRASTSSTGSSSSTASSSSFAEADFPALGSPARAGRAR